AGDLSFQLLDLMEHLALGDVQGLEQRRVQPPERLFITLEHRADGSFALIEAAGQRGWKGFLLHFRAKVLRSGEKIANLKTVLSEKASNRRLDDGETGTRNNRGHAAKDFAIQHLRLREVGDFRRTSEVRGRGQQRILHHRTQQSTGSEGLWRRAKRGVELRAREFGVPGKEFPVAAAKRLPAAVNFVEQKRGFVRDLHLVVETGGFELLRTCEQTFAERIRIVESSKEKGPREAMKPGVERIDEDDSPAGKKPSHELAERRTERLTLRVGLTQRDRAPVGVGAFRRPGGGFTPGSDPGPGNSSAEVAPCVFRFRGQLVADQSVTRIPKGMIDLGEVVILGREPENRNRVDAATR